MRAALEKNRCSMCRHDLRILHETGHGMLKILENGKEIVLLHCPRCGSLLIQVETAPAQSR